MKPLILYHGSPNKLIGNTLIPKKSSDVNNNPENVKTAIYATDKKELAMTMGIICSKGVKGSSLDFNKPSKEPPFGTIYCGKPKSEIFYLHYLNAKDFKKSNGLNHQYFSTKPIKPLKTEILMVKEYKDYIKYASPEEKEEWNRKITKYNQSK